jgi:hypothetical protein
MERKNWTEDASMLPMDRKRKKEEVWRWIWNVDEMDELELRRREEHSSMLRTKLLRAQPSNMRQELGNGHLTPFNVEKREARVMTSRNALIFKHALFFSLFFSSKTTRSRCKKKIPKKKGDSEESEVGV